VIWNLPHLCNITSKGIHTQ